MIERPDIDALMAGGLGQWLEGQNAVREQAKKDTRARRVKVFLAMLPVAGVLLMIDLSFAAWGTIILGLLGLAWAQGPVRKAVKDVKIGINEAIAGALGLTYSHDCEPGQPFELAKECRLLPSHDRASFEDQWSGTIGDIPFMLHETKLEERRGSGKHRRWVTVFQGVVMSVGYARRFHGTTLLGARQRLPEVLRRQERLDQSDRHGARLCRDGPSRF